MMSRAHYEALGVAIVSSVTFYRLQGHNGPLIIGQVRAEHILHTDNIRPGAEKDRAHTSVDPTSLRRSNESPVIFCPLWLKPTLSGISQWKTQSPSFRSKPFTQYFRGRRVSVGNLVSEDELDDGKLCADKVPRSLFLSRVIII